MNLLLNQVQGILTLFSQLEDELVYLNDNPDDLRTARLEFLTTTIETKKSELKSLYSADELKKLNPLFEDKIDSIQKKLESIIAFKKEESEKIKFLLKIHRNRKKVIQYKK